MIDYDYFKNLVNEIKEMLPYLSKSVHKNNTDIDNKIFSAIYTDFYSAVEYFNNACGFELIFIDMLSVEIFKLIISYEELNSCFYLVSRYKIVFVFSEESGLITFFGKDKKPDDQNIYVNRKFVQLLRLTYHLDNGDYKLKDNTGNEIENNEVIYQILKWTLIK